MSQFFLFFLGSGSETSDSVKTTIMISINRQQLRYMELQVLAHLIVAGITSPSIPLEGDKVPPVGV